MFPIVRKTNSYTVFDYNGFSLWVKTFSNGVLKIIDHDFVSLKEYHDIFQEVFSDTSFGQTLAKTFSCDSGDILQIHFKHYDYEGITFKLTPESLSVLLSVI